MPAGVKEMLIVLKEGVVGVGNGGRVACVRVCISLPCVSLSLSRPLALSLPSWLALARNGAGKRLTDGNNVQYSRSSAALAAERSLWSGARAV